MTLDTPALRRCALAVAVLTDLDLEPATDGVVLAGTPELRVPWEACEAALGGHPPDRPEARTGLARWLLRRRWVADHPADDLAERVRPVGLPVGHTLHPGESWVRQQVLGGALDLGLGFLGIQPGQPDRVVMVAGSVLEAAGLAELADDWWAEATSYLEQMGAMAAERFHRNGVAQVLRPMGDCDVVTLLASYVFRSAVTGTAGGMRPAVVPMRTRGWLDVNRIDPAFGPAAAAATDPIDRGFPRPLLLTQDEVVQVAAGGDFTIALSDPVADSDGLRPVLYR